MPSSVFPIATETLPGVFHALAWGQDLPEDFLQILILQAKRNVNKKARLCLHPTPSETLQVTYLAFSNPYADEIHSHPHRPEVLIPIFGQARHSIYNEKKERATSQTLNGEHPVAFSTPPGTLHGISVLSESFVMIEIGVGPFTEDSTVYYIDRLN